MSLSELAALMPVGDLPREFHQPSEFSWGLDPFGALVMLESSSRSIVCLECLGHGIEVSAEGVPCAKLPLGHCPAFLRAHKPKTPKTEKLRGINPLDRGSLNVYNTWMRQSSGALLLIPLKKDFKTNSSERKYVIL